MKRMLYPICSLLLILPNLVSAEGFQTDMEHKVQFKLKEVNSKQYQLEVARSGDVNFARMNMFATRKAKKLCGKNGFSITYVEGVEGFDDRKSNPNLILSSLKVKVTC